MKILSVLSVIGVLMTSGFASASGEDKELVRFDRLFDIKMREAGVPGAAFAIVENGEIKHIGMHGTRGVKVSDSVDADTVFRLASVSKTFAGTLTAKLAQDKVLNLSDPIAPHNPRLRLQSDRNLNALTVEHALSHTTGLVSNAYDNMLEDGWDLNKILPRFNKVKTLCAPGKCYGYQNIMFALVEPVIEAKTGGDYGALVVNQLFGPLGMATASVGMDGYALNDNRAEPHLPTRRGLREIKVKEDYYRVAPAAGVNASITDMAKWLIAQTGHRQDVLPDAVLQEIRTKRIKTRREMYKRLWKPHLKNAHYGLGWRIYDFHGEELVAHGGAVAGFRSLVAYSPSRDVGVAILMNANSQIIDELMIDYWRNRQENSAIAVASSSASVVSR